MTAVNTVLVFRRELLPLSESFIAEQTRALCRFRVVFVGLKRLPNRISLSHPSGLSLTGQNSIRDKLRRKLFSEARYDPGFLKRIVKESPMLVHAHFAVDACLALPIAKRLDIPLIVTLHGYDVTRNDRHHRTTAPGRIYLRRRRELWRQASLFVCVSEYIRRKALERGFPEEKLWVHRIGVDLEMFQPRRSQTFARPLVLFAGRLVENKGCIYLIRSMVRVQKEFPEARLVVVGDGPLRASLEAEARNRLRLFTFTGMQPHCEVRRWMQEAAVLVMPSVEILSGDSEGLGMVMCEAQAMGLPGIAFRGTGVEEALAYGESGLLVNSGDEQALTAAILRVLRDKDLQAHLAAAGRRHAEACLDLHKQTAVLEDKYEQILSRR
jgi:glycosyltransferase involved in cell wall biosynthesis